MNKIKDQSGFTRTELMLAMVLFSTVLVISTVGFIGMNRTFSRGTIKKQLSESVQRTTEDISRTLRSQPSGGSPSAPVPCAVDAAPAACSHPGYTVLSHSAGCYFWPVAEPGNQTGGLYSQTGSCASVNPSTATLLMRSRYMVRELSVASVTSNSDLFQIQGTFTTLVDNAIRFNGSGGVESCKGSSENRDVNTCAVQKFNTIVSTQGSPS